MAIDYEDFRRTTWEQRIAIFGALPPEGKAELFRSQITGWLERNRAELTEAQIAILDEAIELATPALYAPQAREGLFERVNDLGNRARAVLGPEKALDALTMQWGMT